MPSSWYSCARSTGSLPSSAMRRPPSSWIARRTCSGLTAGGGTARLWRTTSAACLSAVTSAIQWPTSRGRAGLQRSPVAPKATVAVGHDLPGRGAVAVERGAGVAGAGDRLAGGLEVVGVGQPREPAVDHRQQVALAEVHRPGVVEAGGGGVLGRVAAAVVGLLVDPLACRRRWHSPQCSRPRSR
jgi:hypothetical protein